MILNCKYLKVRKAPGGILTGYDSYCHHTAYYGKDCKGFDECEFFVEYKVGNCQKVVL